MEQCPICFTELETRDCAPCDDCGWNVPTEVEHMHERRHTYTTYEIYDGLRLTLCNVCFADFGSYKPEYLGKQMDINDFNFVKEVGRPEIVKDKFCPQCFMRLKFLKFVAEMRRINGVAEGD